MRNKRSTGGKRHGIGDGGWVNGGITNVERRTGTGGQLVWETMSLERKKTRGNKMMKSVTANGVDSAWDSLKDVLREIEAAVSAITRSLQLRIGNQ
jgi:hypothetical protein